MTERRHYTWRTQDGQVETCESGLAVRASLLLSPGPYRG